jgi:acyl-[acyl-carrier-protein] desaturase
VNDIALQAELEPRAAELLDRHLAAAREWFPHDLVPYGRGRDFEPGHVWAEEDADVGGAELPDAVRSALFVNLLTEDNLPYYSRDIGRIFGADGAFGTWVRRWTAEEGRHSIVLRDYLTATRAIDPVALERGRMTQVCGGQVPVPPTLVIGMVYATLQELATRIAHRNTGAMVGDPAAYEVMSRVAADENLHHLFYRDLTTTALEVDPSGTILAIEEVVRTFAMPGKGIPGFERHSMLIAQAGIYDATIHHDQILVPVVLHQWKVDQIEGLSPEAEEARTRLMDRMERVARLARTLAERRERAMAAADA